MSQHIISLRMKAVTDIDPKYLCCDEKIRRMASAERRVFRAHAKPEDFIAACAVCRKVYGVMKCVRNVEPDPKNTIFSLAFYDVDEGEGHASYTERDRRGFEKNSEGFYRAH